MFYHVVALTLADTFGASEMARVSVFAERIKLQCEGLDSFGLAPNLSDRGDDYTHSLVAVFRSAAAYDPYPACEGHVALAEFMQPFIRRMAVLDFELH
jgi:hypothetical protein